VTLDAVLVELVDDVNRWMDAMTDSKPIGDGVDQS
jgi:hypothetical protein